jgi:chromosome segregation ATPase
MSEIQNHLVAQNDRSERICASLEKLADSMGDAPANARQQAQSLETIAAQMEATRTHTQNLATSLSDLPTVARNQGEALKSIHRQLEVSGEQSAMTTQTMDRLGTAINSLSSSNDLQAERLRQMSDHNDEQTERLTSMLARQNKHFLMLFVVTAVLAAAAVAAVTVLAFQIAKI